MECRHTVESAMHHKAKVPGEVVERIRAQFEAGKSYRKLAAQYGIPENTVKDWVFYRTRINADIER